MQDQDQDRDQDKDQDQDQDEYLPESHLRQQYPGGLQVLDEAGLAWQQEDDRAAPGPNPGGAAPVHVARHTDWGGKLHYPVNLGGGGDVTGGGEAAAADTGQAAGGGDREVTWPAGAGPSRPWAAMSVHSNTPLVDSRKSCILVKSVMRPHLWRMSIHSGIRPIRTCAFFFYFSDSTSETLQKKNLDQ